MKKNNFYEKYSSNHKKNVLNEIDIEFFKGKVPRYNKQFKKILPKDTKSKILELGCGNGSLVWWLNSIGYSNVNGIDISEEQVEIGKNLGLDNIHCGDAFNYLNERSNYFNVIFALDFLEHFNKEEITTLLSLCHNSLTADGLIVVQVPNAESPFFGRIRYGDFTHEIAFTASSLKQLFLQYRFKELDFMPYEPISTNLKSFIRLMTWRFLSLAYSFFITVEMGSTKKRIVTQNIICFAKK